MESFQELISSIPDAKTLLVPNEILYSSSLKTIEDLSEDLNEYIITQGFDEEQIWSQISLISPKLIEALKSLKNQSSSESDISVHSSKPSESEAEASEEPQESHSSQSKDFFDIDEMKRFADEGEAEKEDPGLSVSEESDSEEEEMKYDQFFEDKEFSEEEQEKIFNYIDEKEIQRIEEKMVSQKPWQLKGEVTSKTRPKDSLLNENLDFEVARKPVVESQTKQVTDEIEDIIKQRILDMMFDDVQPRKLLEKPQTKTAAEDFLDYEKSKKSLAELYEEDFKKDVLHLPINTEIERAKKEITVVFKKLCYNLDLISSLNPIPRPVVKELEVKNAKVPALVLEEVLPYAVSKEDTKYAKDVFDRKNVNLKAPEELTKADKNNARKRHKATLRTRKKERIIKIMNKIAQDPKAQKFEYRRMIKEEKAKKELIERKKQPKAKFTRSSEFFKTFQELSKEIKTKEKTKEPPLSKKIKL